MGKAIVHFNDGSNRTLNDVRSEDMDVVMKVWPRQPELIKYDNGRNNFFPPPGKMIIGFSYSPTE